MNRLRIRSARPALLALVFGTVFVITLGQLIRILHIEWLEYFTIPGAWMAVLLLADGAHGSRYFGYLGAALNALFYGGIFYAFNRMFRYPR